ncbi:unnamed protein product [Spirodela intermedia]|uniref:Phytocyanin domain-containing protein n=1 Tax=Spirodela intermedia TaxID=51605 RepID=A0A7I8JU79_SPIIN|nr:unnamed protein product [Spirodela intermedia]CAA6673654.1 unnamed protein product [Spirodela intermedia]
MEEPYDERHRRRQPLHITGFLFLCAAVLLAPHGGNVAAALQHKVGDLDAWGIPPSSKPDVYSIWSQTRSFQMGDSLMFLYPPSQDAVVQVTALAFESCSIEDPILKMDDGNSLFNITSAGEFYFTSGVVGRCEKNQRLRISIGGGNARRQRRRTPPRGRSPALPPRTPTSSARPRRRHRRRRRPPGSPWPPPRRCSRFSSIPSAAEGHSNASSHSATGLISPISSSATISVVRWKKHLWFSIDGFCTGTILI